MNFDVSCCTKFQIFQGSALPLDPAGRAYSTPGSPSLWGGALLPLPKNPTSALGPWAFLSIRGLRKGPGKFLSRVLESPGKVLDFFVSKRVGTLCYRPTCCCTQPQMLQSRSLNCIGCCLFLIKS